VLEAKTLHQGDKFAWGQFLDGDRNHKQFGVFGTSAAVVLLVNTGIDPKNDAITKGQASLPFLSGAEEAITRHEVNDTSSTFKLAAILDAQKPENSIVSNSSDVAERLVSSIVDGRGWGNYCRLDGERDVTPRIEPTAIALLSLSRVQTFRGSPDSSAALTWLATEVARQSESPPEIDALSLLVFSRFAHLLTEVDLAVARDRCLGRLRGWRRRFQHDTSTHAEYHYEIPTDTSAGESKYVFFPIHVLVALAFLTEERASQGDRVWAAEVVLEVVQSVRSHHGYRVGAKVCTVDQLWVVRLLDKCIEVGSQTPGRLIRRPLNRFESVIGRIVLAMILLVLGTVGTTMALADLPVGVRAFGSVLGAVCLGALVILAIAWFGGSDDHP
jgi:hypothetical protein